MDGDAADCGVDARSCARRVVGCNVAVAQSHRQHQQPNTSSPAPAVQHQPSSTRRLFGSLHLATDNWHLAPGPRRSRRSPAAPAAAAAWGRRAWKPFVSSSHSPTQCSYKQTTTTSKKHSPSRNTRIAHAPLLLYCYRPVAQQASIPARSSLPFSLIRLLIEPELHHTTPDARPRCWLARVAFPLHPGLLRGITRGQRRVNQRHLHPLSCRGNPALPFARVLLAIRKEYGFLTAGTRPQLACRRLRHS